MDPARCFDAWDDAVELNLALWQLVDAAAAGDVRQVNETLAAYPSAARETREPGVTALMRAAEHGHAECVRALLPFSDPDAACDKHWVSHDGISYLDTPNLDWGSKVSARWVSETSALGFAALNGHLDCVKLLLPRSRDRCGSDGRTALMFAAAGGQAECVRFLMASADASDAKTTTSNGYSALMDAALYGRVDCVELLLPVSDATARTAAGVTALMWAATAGNTDCVELLLPSSDALHVDMEGATALHWTADAIEEGEAAHLAILRTLVAAGGSLIQDRLGRTPLMRLIDGFDTVDSKALANVRDAVRILAPESDAGAYDAQGQTALDIVLDICGAADAADPLRPAVENRLSVAAELIGHYPEADAVRTVLRHTQYLSQVERDLALSMLPTSPHAKRAWDRALAEAGPTALPRVCAKSEQVDLAQIADTPSQSLTAPNKPRRRL
jgi:ankyrin repeat protein